MKVYSKEHIEAYVEGKLNEQELLTFEQALAEDEDLQKMVEGYQILKSKHRQPKLWLNESKRKLEGPKRRRTRKWFHYGTAAAIIALLSWGGFSITNKVNEVSFDFKDAGLPVLLGAKNNMNAIMNAYHEENIPLAYSLLENYIQTFGASDTTRYYEGVFLKEQGDYEKALEKFIPDSIKQPVLRQKTEMQQAICLKYLGQNQKAEEVLDHIRAQENHIFAP